MSVSRRAFLKNGGVAMIGMSTLPGFLRITVTRQSIGCEYFKVPPPPNHMSESHPAELVESVKIGL